MFTIESDKTINITRGDILYFSVMAEDNGVPYTFKAGDIVRISVYGKKDCENVVLQKDFPVTTATEEVEIYLTKEDTKIGEIINKQKDCWYEIVLNPDTEPQTIIGYDDDGAKVFRLFPEGEDIPENDKEVLPEEIPIIDDELDLLSNRPVRNKVIAKEVVRIDDAVKEINNKLDEANKDNADKYSDTTEALSQIGNDLLAEKERIDNIGKVLFEGSVTTGNEIEFDASKHSLFAIKVHCTLADCVVFCGKSDLQVRGLISGSNSVTQITNDLEGTFGTYYFRVCIKVAESGNKHTVVAAHWNSKAEFSNEWNDTTTAITEIIGIV